MPPPSTEDVFQWYEDEVNARLRDKVEADKIRAQLEWLWTNCRIIYFPVSGAYPLEHTLFAKKNARQMIEAEMRSVPDPNSKVH
jgi:hypothetical protein